MKISVEIFFLTGEKKSDQENQNVNVRQNQEDTITNYGKGVIKESCLSPILFNWYTNNLPGKILKSYETSK